MALRVDMPAVHLYVELSLRCSCGQTKVLQQVVQLSGWSSDGDGDGVCARVHLAVVSSEALCPVCAQIPLRIHHHCLHFSLHYLALCPFSPASLKGIHVMLPQCSWLVSCQDACALMRALGCTFPMQLVSRCFFQHALNSALVVKVVGIRAWVFCLLPADQG